MNYDCFCYSKTAQVLELLYCVNCLMILSNIEILFSVVNYPN